MNLASRNILIVSPEDDTHARLVAWSLREAGHKVCFWDTAEAVQKPGYSIELNATGETKISIEGHTQLDHAWLRRVFRTARFALPTSKEDREYISAENRRYVDNALERLSRNGTPWLNGKPASIEGELKVEQLEACKANGVRIPNTLISNDPAKIREFIRANHGAVVKPIDVYTWERPDGSRLMTHANTISIDQLDRIADEEFLACPAIHQQIINKRLNLRVVYVGGKVFACSIENTNDDCIDFRPFQTDGTLVFSPFEAPESLRRDIAALANHFGLTLASSDFCVGDDGEIYFLDLNPGGAFLFVEYHGGGRIVSEIAAQLGGGDSSLYKGVSEYNAQASAELQVLSA